MKTFLHSALLFFIAFIYCNSAYAQSPVYAQVSSKKVQVGVPFEYAIVISVSANGYLPPNLKDFDVVSGPNQSMSTQIVNGAVSTNITMSWGLVARKEGKYTIGPAVVTSGNTRYETNPVAIEAVKGAVTQSQGGNETAAAQGAGDHEVFIKAIPAKTKIYVGEQVTITYKLFSRLSVLGMKKYNPPVFDGFWTKRLETPGGVMQQEIVDGVAYQTVELDKYLLNANSDGKKVIKPTDGTFVIRKILANRKPRNIFEQFFGSQQYEDVEAVVKSNAVNIDVMPLPEAGKPADFNGAVGKLNWNVEASRTELKANEAFNLKITISGNGNFPLISAPQLNLPEEFESYNPKVVENNGSKTFDFLIIPRKEGEYVLNNLHFSYFNLETKKYVTLDAPEIKIRVWPGDAGSNEAQVYLPQNQIKETENDIRYIKKGNFQLTKTETEFFNSPTHIALMSGSVLLLLFALVGHKSYVRKNSDIVAVRERKAAGVAKKQLSRAEKLMNQNNKDGFYTEILTAINNYVSFKLNVPVAELSRDRIQAALTSRHVNPEQIVKLLSTIETSEYAKYAPGAVSGDLQQVYSDTVNLITNIEAQLARKNK